MPNLTHTLTLTLTLPITATPTPTITLLGNYPSFSPGVALVASLIPPSHQFPHATNLSFDVSSSYPPPWLSSSPQSGLDLTIG